MKAAEFQNASLGEKITAKRAGRLATTPESVKGHFVAAWAGKCSPRRAIKAQCLECVGLLCAFFREMQTDAGDGNEWFVAGGYRACAKLLGHKNHSTVETWIGALHTMKILQTVKPGDAHHSTRYRYKLPIATAP